MDSKRILILGATGRTCKWVLTYALGKGYWVNTLVDETLLKKLPVI